MITRRTLFKSTETLRSFFVPAKDFIESIKWFAGSVLILHWVGVLPESSVEAALILSFIALCIADKDAS